MSETIEWGDRELTLRQDAVRVGRLIIVLLPNNDGFAIRVSVRNTLLLIDFGRSRQVVVNKAYKRCTQLFKDLGKALDYEVES